MSFAEIAALLSRDQLRYPRQIQAASPIIAVDPNSPATARPRFGGALSGDGVGLSVANGVIVGSDVCDGVTDAVAVADGSGVWVGSAVGGAVGGCVGTGVAVVQNGGRHGSVGVGDGEADAVGGGVSCAFARVMKNRSDAAPKTRTAATRRTLHLNNEVRLGRANTGQAVNPFEHDLSEVLVVRKLAEREDVRLTPARVRLLHAVQSANRCEDVLRVAGLDRNQNVRRRHRFLRYAPPNGKPSVITALASARIP